MKFETYTLPAYWAPYLINADPSGMEEEEIQEVDAFLERNGLGFCLDCDNEQEFSWSNAANDLGGAVADFTFEVH